MTKRMDREKKLERLSRMPIRGRARPRPSGALSVGPRTTLVLPGNWTLLHERSNTGAVATTQKEAFCQVHCGAFSAYPRRADR